MDPKCTRTKREASEQISKDDNFDEDEENTTETEAGTWQKASAEEISNRCLS